MTRPKNCTSQSDINSNIDDIWSADLKDMQSLAKENDGHKYLLNVIDLFSKTAYSIPLKSKSSEVIIDAFERLFTFVNSLSNASIITSHILVQRSCGQTRVPNLLVIGFENF